MKIWFMYDNHTFDTIPSLDTHPRDVVRRAILDHFADDRYGSVFARASDGRATFARAHKVEDVDRFLDQCDEHINWEARG